VQDVRNVDEFRAFSAGMNRAIAPFGGNASAAMRVASATIRALARIAM
jgi:hypothetical protein